MTDKPEYQDRVLDTAAKLAEGFEGFSATPYLCPAHVWTIGYGSTRDRYNKPVTASTPPVTRDQAHDLMMRDLTAAFNAVEVAVEGGITDEEEAAMVDFVYNVGVGAFQKSTLLKLFNAADYDGAAAVFDKWNKGGGKVLAGLVRRRDAEEALFRKGYE